MIVLNTEMNHDPVLTSASLIHHLVGDLLCQNGYQNSENSDTVDQTALVATPEIIDMAVVGVGLGLLRSRLEFVQQSGKFWDSTYWTEFPQPFLDTQTLAYCNAMVAWIRGQRNPEWASELSSEVKRPMLKSLKFLSKTNDSFFDPKSSEPNLTQQPQTDWIRLASERSVSKQIVAVRHFRPDDALRVQQENALQETLRSPDRDLVLNSIGATETLHAQGESLADELRLLVEDSDDEIRSKALIALTRNGLLDEPTLELANRMVASKVKHVVFAGMLALGSQESVSDDALKVAGRGFIRALQAVDDEFIRLFITAFGRWLDDPRPHIDQLLSGEFSEYKPLAMSVVAELENPTPAI